MNIKKKIISAVLCAIMVMSVGVIGVSANNHTDTQAIFNFSGGQSRITSEARLKEDSSYSYIKCTGINRPAAYFSAKVYGVNSGGSPVDCSEGHSYRLFSGTTCYAMYNKVHEWGFTHAAIYGTPYDFSTYTATVLWSPDSI